MFNLCGPPEFTAQYTTCRPERHFTRNGFQHISEWSSGDTQPVSVQPSDAWSPMFSVFALKLMAETSAATILLLLLYNCKCIFLSEINIYHVFQVQGRSFLSHIMVYLPLFWLQYNWLTIEIKTKNLNITTFMYQHASAPHRPDWDI